MSGAREKGSLRILKPFLLPPPLTSPTKGGKVFGSEEQESRIYAVHAYPRKKAKELILKESQLAKKLNQAITPANAEFQKTNKTLDPRFRGNDT